MSRSWHQMAVAVALVALSFPVTAGPQGAQSRRPEPPRQTFTERVDVQVVNVEVFVTDKSGAPVAGLSREDFELHVDGKAVEVTNFYAVTGEPGDESAPDPELREEVPESAPAVPEERRLHLVVYVDNFNLRPSNRRPVLDSLEGFLEERTGQGDRVMLVTVDQGVKVVQPFTEDRRLVLDALARVRTSRTVGQTEDTRRSRTARDIAVALADPQTASYAEDYLNRYIQETEANLVRSTRSLKSVVSSLAGLPGRKALLYISDGLPKRPGEQLREQFFGATPSDRMEETALFSTIADEANANQVTFYALHARGGVGISSVSAETRDLAGSAAPRAALDAARNLNYQEPLLAMAAPTGGATFLNTSNFDLAFETLGRDFDTYYSLGFQPDGPIDAKRHRVEVKVRRPGVTVRHRTGFVQKSERQRMADRTLGSLVVPPAHNPLGISLQFGPPEKKKGDVHLLPVLVRIPMGPLTLLPNGETLDGNVRIFLAVQDEEGRTSDLTEVPYTVQVPRQDIERARRSDAGYAARLKTRRGTQKVAVGVLDEGSGVGSFVQELVLVGDEKKRKKKRG